MDLFWPLLALEAVTAALAIWLAVRRGGHWPAAALLAYALLADSVQHWIKVGILNHTTRPFTGWPRVAYHAKEALFLGWGAAVASLAVVALLRRRPWLIVGAWVMFCGSLILRYPELREEALKPVYLKAQIAVVIISAVACAAWFARREAPEPWHSCALLFASGELAILIGGPFSTDIFKRWDLAQVIYLFVYVAAVVLHVGWILRGRREKWSRGSPDSTSGL